MLDVAPGMALNPVEQLVALLSHLYVNVPLPVAAVVGVSRSGSTFVQIL